MKIRLLMILALLTTQTAWANQNATAAYFEKIKTNPQQLLMFLQDMPKGGDLHNHTGGAGMAENLIRYAAGEHLCVDPTTLKVGINPQCALANSLDQLPQNATLYNAIIDSWSMRNFYSGKESGHDHFFATFAKYGAITKAHSAELLTEISERAGQQNESYLELMVTPELASSIGDKVGWDEDFTMLRQKMLAAGIDDLINKVKQDLDSDSAKQQKTLACQTKQASLGCQVKVRYLFQVLREQQPVQVFAQLLAGFEAASRDKRIVGINMVQPEDGYLSMRDYRLHMRMVGFLHKLYPKVHISLHAGELNSSLVPVDGLRFHIRDAVEIANAERIGHGVDVVYETKADQLLREMADKQIMVEINLSSNAQILGVEGANHPLPIYIRYHVPIALSTDDEGVLRTDLTEQYQKAILTYHFDYVAIKNLVRNSIAYSFLPGEKLWLDMDYKKMNAACAHDSLISSKISDRCNTFLQVNEKAQMQWDLEKRFNLFEQNKKE